MPDDSFPPPEWLKALVPAQAEMVWREVHSRSELITRMPPPTDWVQLARDYLTGASGFDIEAILQDEYDKPIRVLRL